MTWRDRLHVCRSIAEEDLHIDIQRAGLTDKLFPLGTVFAFQNNNMLILSPEHATVQALKDCECWTVPDFPFITDKGPVPVYLDGHPHRRRGVKNRDDRIDKFWRRFGVEPLRFPYNGKLSAKRRAGILNRIKRRINK